MLHLFQSNEMSELARVFCERSSGASDPFKPLTVIVQSFGIGQWLKLETARHQGIAANIDCVLPAAFLWRMYRQHIPETRSIDNSPFDRSRLAWRIMRLLAANPGLSGAVSNYLSAPGDRDLRIFQLSTEIAGLFDEYLMYRPGRVLDWEKQPARDAPGHESWQRELWRLLVEDIGDAGGMHRAGLHRRLLEILASDRGATGEQLTVFGLSTMPPLQMQTFEALATVQDVDIYFLNPCEHYWGDIASERDIAVKRSIRALVSHEQDLVEEDYLEAGNPLLSSLGRQGREYLEMLLDSDVIQTTDCFVSPDGDSALALVKNDILGLTYGGEFGSSTPPSEKASGDSSLQIHVCHSRLREVEVLLDQIQHMIALNPEIAASDILVMVPDIGNYAPYIHAVFTGRLAFRVTDRTAGDEGSITDCFLTLLGLAQSRLTATEVIDLLEVPAVSRRYQLSPEDREKIAWWISNAGVRWETSGAAKAKHWDLPPENNNTWEFGLQRLLAGLALPLKGGTWERILPFDITPADTELLGKVCHFIERLDHFRQAFHQVKPASEWRDLTGQLIEEFFEPAREEVLQIDAIIEAAESFELCAGETGYTEPVSSALLRQHLQAALIDEGGSAGFISGGITFATLVPMRSIPFKVICLLGMNDGDYPRRTRPHSFDLMATSGHERGDRSRRLDDRYLFLEALISAGEVFYVSYVGRGNRDNKNRPPSVVVREWQNYLDAVFSDMAPRYHPLQPFNAAYYDRDRSDGSFERRWYAALNAPAATPAFVSGPLPPDPAFDCTSHQQLIQFHQHTARYFMQQRLGVYFPGDDIELQDTEPFTLDGLDRYQLADGALNALASGNDLKDWRDQTLASGAVMTGIVGDRQLNTEIRKAEDIYTTVRPYLDGDSRTLTGNVTVNGQSLPLHLTDIYDNRIVNYRAGTLRARHLLSAWISHLFANLHEQGLTTVCIAGGRKGASETILKPVSAERCEALISDLLTIYNRGVNQPLLLPCEAARAYVENLESTPAEARSKALARYESEYENRDPYWERLFNMHQDLDATFQANATTTWQPLLEAL